MKPTKLLLLLFVIFLSSCNDDNNIPINEEETQTSNNSLLEIFGDEIQSRFIGTVINEQNNPISGVTINIGSQFTTTDSNGVFSMPSATVQEKFAYVKASKSGFIDGSRALMPTDGVNQVEIMLLSLEPTATITAGQAVTVDLPDGTEVDFSGEFINQSGSEYQGEVDVIIKPLNVDNEDFQLMMPGNLTAQDSEGELTVLESYGMIAVELRGENGEELNINPNNPATLKFAIGSSITNPPTTIPLWYFNEEFGYWVVEGSATLEGGKYIGEVTHFSFWNCDDPFHAIEFCVTLVDGNGNTINNTNVVLTREGVDWNATGVGYTDENGTVCGLIPSNEMLTLTISEFGCLNNDFTTTIGPFSTDQNITVTVQDSLALTTNFTAIFNDCNGDAITNGYLQLFYNNETQNIPITNGVISQTIIYCPTDTSYSAQVIDLTNSQSTDVVNGDFTAPITDLGTTMSCVDLSDTDNDGVLDINEDLNGNNNLDDDDTDGDDIPDYQDEDDDNDGVNTVNEDYDNDGNPMNEDSDGDGIPDYLDVQDVANIGSEIHASNCDVNNAEYDLTSQIESGIFPNTTFTYHETQADAEAGINTIATPMAYLNVYMLQGVHARGTNTITDAIDVGTIFLLGINTSDSDNDGLLYCEEISGTNYAYTGCNPNGNITNPNNADTDGDGFNDCIEGHSATDPNDSNSFPTSGLIAVDDIQIGADNYLFYVLNNDLYDVIPTIYLVNQSGEYVTTLDIFQEGVWVVESSLNRVAFYQSASSAGPQPNPINYVLIDSDGNVSNQTTITLEY